MLELRTIIILCKGKKRREEKGRGDKIQNGNVEGERENERLRKRDLILKFSPRKREKETEKSQSELRGK